MRAQYRCKLGRRLLTVSRNARYRASYKPTEASSGSVFISLIRIGKDEGYAPSEVAATVNATLQKYWVLA